MPSTLLRRFLRRFTGVDTDERDGDESDDDTGDSDGRFIPSPLDMSVRYSHGSPENEANREIAKIQREAEKREGRHR